jgi:hypothetical protein
MTGPLDSPHLSRRAFGFAGSVFFCGQVAASPRVSPSQGIRPLGIRPGARYADKVTLCHKGKVTINVAAPAQKAHEAHGDHVGACATTSASATKAKQAKGKNKG